MAVEVVSRDLWVPDRLRLLPGGTPTNYDPRTELGRYVRDAVLEHLPAEVAAELVRRISRSVVAVSRLHGMVRRYDWDRLRYGPREWLGLLSEKVVTDAGVQFLVDCLQNQQEPETLKYHAIGTGTTAEAASQTALVTEWAGADYTGGVRPTGSLTEGASANIFRTVGTNTKASSGTSGVNEHAIMSTAGPTGGTMLDRSYFGSGNTLNLIQNDQFTTTYDFTLTSGG